MQIQTERFDLQGMEILKRYYTTLFQEYLELFPCVALVRVRQCGKTTMLTTLPEDWPVFDLEKQSDYQAVSHDVDLFFRLHPEKIAIDEAHLHPDIFPALRLTIDRERHVPGRFVLTGSSSPAVLKSVSENLAGRIAVIEMGPLSFAEIRNGRVPDAITLLADPNASAADFLDIPAASDLPSIQRYWFFGGYREPWVKKSARFHGLWMNHYALFGAWFQLWPLGFRVFAALSGSATPRLTNPLWFLLTSGLNAATPGMTTVGAFASKLAHVKIKSFFRK